MGNTSPSPPQTMLQQIIFFEIFIFSELHHLQSCLQNFQTLLPNLNLCQLTLVNYKKIYNRFWNHWINFSSQISKFLSDLITNEAFKIMNILIFFSLFQFVI